MKNNMVAFFLGLLIITGLINAMDGVDAAGEFVSAADEEVVASGYEAFFPGHSEDSTLVISLKKPKKPGRGSLKGRDGLTLGGLRHEIEEYRDRFLKGYVSQEDHETAVQKARCETLETARVGYILEETSNILINNARQNYMPKAAYDLAVSAIKKERDDAVAKERADSAKRIEQAQKAHDEALKAARTLASEGHVSQVENTKRVWKDRALGGAVVGAACLAWKQLAPAQASSYSWWN